MGDRPRDEQELIRRARNGDVRAYQALIELYEDVAFRTAYVITLDASEAEDAVQEALVGAFAALRRFHDGAPLRPWLLRIVANEAKDRRAAATRQRVLALRAANGWVSGDAVPSPEAALVSGEEQARVRAALARLRPNERLVIAYRYFLDLSERETAAAIGCPQGTVKSRLSRALDRLRRELEALE